MNPKIKQRIEQIRQGEVPEEYKKTKAGIMPEEWEEKFIKDISSDICAGATPETKVSEYWKNGTIPWLASGEIHKRRIYQTEKSITEKGYLSSSTKMIPENCVLIALAGQGKTRGTVAVNKIPLCTNQSIVAIIPNNCYYQYLYYFLDIRYNNLREISSGDGTRGGLNLNLIANYPVTIPPLPEQQKIADILTTQDRVIELKEQLLTQKQQHKKYLMQQLLTGKKRLPGFSGEWKKEHLGKLFSERKETNCQNLEMLAITGNQGIIPRAQLDLKDNSSDDKSKYLKVCIGDIGYNTMRMWQGVSAYSNYEGIVSPAYTILKPCSNINAKYFSYLFKMPKTISLFYRFSQGLVDDTRNLKYENFKKIRVSYPVDKEEQTAIADVLSTADREIDLLRQSIESEKQKKKVLMQLLLTGIVRVNV